ncbi:hypothetical protein ACIOJ9_39990 [Streptomyces sp. NPDC088175]|uniref:hypothetical protein n=1 Tax=unclassified Streptomyces TaxID=2593676 RepID=UPI00381FBF62
MTTIYPSSQRTAGHVPADLLPVGRSPHTVVIVQQAPRSYSGPAVLVLAAALGSGLVIYLLMALIQVTADAATEIYTAAGGVSVGGVTLKLTKGGKK